MQLAEGELAAGGLVRSDWEPGRRSPRERLWEVRTLT